MPLTHTKVSPKPDGAFPSQVQASDWNAGHDLSGFSWQDLPAALKAQDLRPAQLMGDYTAEQNAYAVKGTLFYAETDIQISAVHAYQAITSTTNHICGIASATVTEVGGVATAVTTNAILGEAPSSSIGSSVGWAGGALTSPVTISAGTYFLAYTRTVVQDRPRLAYGALPPQGLGVRPVSNLLFWTLNTDFPGPASAYASTQVSQSFWVLPTYRIL